MRAISELASMLRPVTITLRPAARAMSTMAWIRPTLEAKSATMTRPGLCSTIRVSVAPICVSGEVDPSRSTLVESESSASTPRSPQRANFCTSVPRPPSARLILKSPVCTIRPSGVSMAMPTPSTTLCPTRMKSRVKSPSRRGSSAEMTCSPPAGVISSSWSFWRTIPSVNAVP